MSEQHAERQQEQPEQVEQVEQPEDLSDEAATDTGNDDVEAVLGSLHGLDDRPVDEHVGVFERAHESLRRILNDAGRQG